MRTIPIPEEIFIITRPDEQGLSTPVGLLPFYDRREAELAAGKAGNTLEVVAYHIIRSVIIG